MEETVRERSPSPPREERAGERRPFHLRSPFSCGKVHGESPRL
jgi:hypothetical protein